MSGKENDGHLRYSVSIVTQGKHKFYTLTMPSNTLAETCFVSTRDEDPKQGFQRILDKGRAKEIADYIDHGFGTIPNSIVLSAQVEAELKDVGRGKTIQFRNTPKAFLILDGQHRVYGFSLAQTNLRVPVVIYNGLTRKDESRLFIDINTKQRPVPNELLLDIKSLAEYETDVEQLSREIFDHFNTDPASPLLGLMSQSEKRAGKISRVTFNAALKPLFHVFGDNEGYEIYEILSAYFKAFITGADRINVTDILTNPTVFRAVMLLFPDIARRVQDKYGKAYTVENFTEVFAPMFNRINPLNLKRPGNSLRVLHTNMVKALRLDFTL